MSHQILPKMTSFSSSRIQNLKTLQLIMKKHDARKWYTFLRVNFKVRNRMNYDTIIESHFLLLSADGTPMAPGWMRTMISREPHLKGSQTITRYSSAKHHGCCQDQALEADSDTRESMMNIVPKAQRLSCSLKPPGPRRAVYHSSKDQGYRSLRLSKFKIWCKNIKYSLR